MQQEARIIRLLADGRAELAVRRETACGSCHSCQNSDSCMLCEQVITVTADNPLCAQPGETVKIQTSTKRVLYAAVLVYLLPLIMFVAGYLLGEALHIYPFYIGVGAFALAGLLAFLYNRYTQKHKRIQYTIIDIQKE